MKILIHTAYAVSTVFGIGYSRVAPGTLASLVAAVFLWFFYTWFLSWLSLVIIALFFVGVYTSAIVAKSSAVDDPSFVVIDEWVGMWLALYPFVGWHSVIQQSLFDYIVVFVFFRLFDITKPFPLKHLEHIPGGWGIMLDDVGAALYAILASLFIFMLRMIYPFFIVF